MPDNRDTQTTSGLVVTPNAADAAFVTNFQITNITGGSLYLNDGVTQVTNSEFITVAQGRGRAQIHTHRELDGLRQLHRAGVDECDRRPDWAARPPRPRSPSIWF